MRLKVGLISEDKLTDTKKLKVDFENLHVYAATNVMEFYNILGANKVDAVIFSGGEKLANEFTSYLHYLRQKPLFKQTPMVVLTEAPIENKHIVDDPMVRHFLSGAGFFVALIGLFNVIKDQQALQPGISDGRIEDEFALALQQATGGSEAFLARPATDDEAHSEFSNQLTDEVASSMVWLKYAARTLKEGDEGLLIGTFASFSNQLRQLLQDEGSLFFVKSDKLPAAEKSAYAKQAKSRSLIFESASNQILVEFIRYI